MRTTQQMSITLPNDMANLVKAKVQAGEYGSESEVIRDGLRTLVARDKAVEVWLREQVLPSIDLMEKDNSLGLSVADIRAKLAKEYSKNDGLYGDFFACCAISFDKFVSLHKRVLSISCGGIQIYRCCG